MRVMRLFGNLIKVNVLNATELYALKWFILCCMNFTSIKKKSVELGDELELEEQRTG